MTGDRPVNWGSLDDAVDQVAFMAWLLLVDRDATRRRYEILEFGDADVCGCSPCANFAASRQEAYPDVVHQLLEDLAIPYDKEIEAPHIAMLAPNVHAYHGWFHFAGRIEQWPDAAQETWVPVTDHFKIGFTKRVALLPSGYNKEDWAQLWFYTELPWIIDLPESE